MNKMGRDIWVISDTHFLHNRILEFLGADGKNIRTFPDVYAMNKYIIEKWNSVVKPGDKIYHLGDVFFGSKDEFKEIWQQLNGKKRLIIGNHDDANFLIKGNFFEKTHLCRFFKEYGVVLSHIPLHKDSFIHKNIKNVHGHIHEKSLNDPDYINVSVEAVDYTPVNIKSFL